jgi:hypothetical protein
MWAACGSFLNVEGTHSVLLQSGRDQPAAFSVAKVVAADVQTLHVGGSADDASDVDGVFGRYRIVAQVNVDDVFVLDHGSSGLFQPSLVDALERELRERSMA